MKSFFLFAVFIQMSLISCRTPGSTSNLNSDNPAIIYHSEVKETPARITGYTLVPSPDADCAGPLCNINLIELEPTDGRPMFQVRVDANSTVDAKHPDSESNTFIELAQKNKSVLMFRTAAYNGPNNLSSLLCIESLKP